MLLLFLNGPDIVQTDHNIAELLLGKDRDDRRDVLFATEAAHQVVDNLVALEDRIERLGRKKL